MLNKIEQYYNKFNEDKRLLSRHGQVEFAVTTRHVDEILSSLSVPLNELKLLDIGAGTGRYSAYYAQKGLDVTAVELVKHNLNIIKERYPSVHSFQGNALNLKKFKDETFDVTLLFGPMYHLFTFEDKVQALSEAKRVTKKGGYIFVAYCMNEYAIIMYAIRENHFAEVIKNGKLDENFRVNSVEDDLYSYETVENVTKINEKCELERVKIFSPDGPTDYVRSYVKAMSEEEFSKYVDFVYAISPRSDLIGAGSHIVDVLKK